MFFLVSYFDVICDNVNNVFCSLLAVPEPVAFYPLNARYKAAEKDNRQPKGIPRAVTITNGPYNEPGGAYMFGTYRSSYIEFPNNGGLDTRFSITLMCWVQPGGRDGPLFYYVGDKVGTRMGILNGKLFIQIVKQRSFEQLPNITTAEVIPEGKWVHVAASYDHNSGNNSLYINGHLRASQNIGTGFEIATASRRVQMGWGYYYNYYYYDGFRGKIAEVKVYDVALNEAQIQTSIIRGN